MLAPLPLLLLAILQSAPEPTGLTTQPVRPTYSGARKELDVQLPQLEGSTRVDGVLDEPQWRDAALLHDFMQYSPVDGRPANDSTEVLVWYSPDAIHFGIRAFAKPGDVRGTLADRDKITNDDHISILLDTFNDRRRAFVFAVNPLGVQSDGIRAEGGGGGGFGRGRGRGGGGGGMSGAMSRAGLNFSDLNQDFVWESSGHLTENGYEVEVRIPFKAVRFDPGNDTWGLQIARHSAYTGYQDTWAPTGRDVASFLGQSGRIHGLHDLRPGLVLDGTPVVTSLISGAPPEAPVPGGDTWKYQTRMEYGGDIRWGVTPNLILNATANPDFSQVEADAGQIPGDVRFALSFPELRPFFVEGSEAFDAPNQLVYTRRIVQPVGAAKLSGKVGNTSVALLTALDGKEYSTSQTDNPLFAVARFRRDLGDQNALGAVVTDREDGDYFNRVGAVDGRFVLARQYTLSFQYGLSDTRNTDGDAQGSIWQVSFDRSGRGWGFRNELEGVTDGFSTRTGFVNRTDFVRANINQRYTTYGVTGARVEQVMWSLNGNANWKHDRFFDGEVPLESRVSLSSTAVLRGGWSFNLQPSVSSDAFDPEDYADYHVQQTTGSTVDTVAFMPGARVTSWQLEGRASTPQFEKFGVSVNATIGNDAEYLEGARAKRVDLSANLDVRPTSQVRVAATMLHQEFRRERDNTTILRTNIPRLRLEYQLNRAIFFRFVGQYESRLRDALRDPATGAPILDYNSDGILAVTEGTTAHGMRVDWLFSLLPSPGRVIYIGYGASLEEDRPFRFRDMTRTSDGLFVKVSYQYRFP